MKKSVLRNCVSVAAIAAMGLFAVPAYAQAAAAPAADDEAATGLDEIVVTASGKDKTKLNSSVSSTSVDAALIEGLRRRDCAPQASGLGRVRPG